ncbi:MAG: ABC transporter permease subunit [Clostridiales bacterium]|nr:ABC transporter permease subunit [Clostridiales bacterium]
MIFKVFEPFLVVLNSLPKSALAPLFIVWLGTNMKTIVIAAVSVAVFGAVLSLYEHFRQTDQEQIKLIYTLGGSKLQVLIKVVIPANLPFILNIMKVNMGLSLVGVIIGEFVAANSGIGYLILYSSQIFKLDLMILSIIILAFIASVFYIILDLLEKRIIKK